jgi:hypothetical protein
MTTFQSDNNTKAKVHSNIQVECAFDTLVPVGGVYPWTPITGRGGLWDCET